MSQTVGFEPYAKGRKINDADAHIVEWPTWLRDYASPAMRDRMPLLWTPQEIPHLVSAAGVDPETRGEVWRELQDVHASEAYRTKALENVMLQKQLSAFGAFNVPDRTIALDRMGFASQLVINTFSNQALQQAEEAGDLELVREMSRAHNRGIVDFCAADKRLLPAGYVPLTDTEQAAAIADEAIKAGCRVLIAASAPPPHHAPSHVDLDGVWARVSEAGVPIALHVGGTGEVLHPSYLHTGRGKTPSFHGGEGPMQSMRVLALPNPAKTLLAAFVYDGVFMDHPGLKVGVYELGATWLPSFMRELDAVARGFRNEPRIAKLDRLPSEYVADRVRVTPYPYEDVSWIMEQAGAQTCMFCSDYPHVEGGRDPIARFDSWLENTSAADQQRFYETNFAEFVGLERRSQAAA